MGVEREYLSIFDDITFRIKRSTNHFIIASKSDLANCWSHSISIPAFSVCECKVLPGVVTLAIDRTFQNPIAGQRRNGRLDHHIRDLIDLFEVESDGHPFEFPAVLKSRALPPSDGHKH